jgi:transposase-like protein
MNEEKEIVMPVCPFCKTKMLPKYFNGYYESFAMWECECSEIPGAKDVSGAYA